MRPPTVSLSYGAPMRALSVIDIKENNRDEHPHYRIDFWERPAEGYAWNNDIWLVDAAPDVAAVIEWAESHARGRRYELLVRTAEGVDGDSYILLRGSNPNDPS